MCGTSYSCGPNKAILDPKTSRRIFELAKDQQDELEMPEDADDLPQQDKSAFTGARDTAEDEEEEENMDSDEGEDAGDVEEIFVSCAAIQDCT